MLSFFTIMFMYRGRKLNVQKTFRRCPGRVLHISCTFNLRPVSRVNIFIRYMTNVLKSKTKIQLCLERWMLWKYCTFLDNAESRANKLFLLFWQNVNESSDFFILLNSLYCKNTDPSTVGVLEEKVFSEFTGKHLRQSLFPCEVL